MMRAGADRQCREIRIDQPIPARLPAASASTSVDRMSGRPLRTVEGRKLR